LPDKVSSRVAAERAARLGELCQRLHREFAEQFIGHEATVLFEGSRKGGMMYGFTGNYIKVSVPYDATLVNTLTPVLLNHWDETSCSLAAEKDERRKTKENARQAPQNNS
jgi:threonylcarbamoyladenosine tRNA methylthiotransferase MtaB